ncbi:MAG: translation initiation factor IF-1 [Patescibacteria group bacterium]
MTDKKDREVSFGRVTEALPNALFRIELESGGSQIMAYLSGKMRLNRIKVLIGDRVELVLDPYGGRARIVRRLDSRKTQGENDFE